MALLHVAKARSLRSFCGCAGGQPMLASLVSCLLLASLVCYMLCQRLASKMLHHCHFWTTHILPCRSSQASPLGACKRQWGR